MLDKIKELKKEYEEKRRGAHPFPEVGEDLPSIEYSCFGYEEHFLWLELLGNAYENVCEHFYGKIDDEERICTLRKLDKLDSLSDTDFTEKDIEILENEIDCLKEKRMLSLYSNLLNFHMQRVRIMKNQLRKLYNESWADLFKKTLEKEKIFMEDLYKLSGIELK